MTKRDCPPGQTYDSLVKRCSSSRILKALRPAAPPSTGPPLPVQVRATTPAPEVSSVTVLSPVLWISVILVSLVSVLIVALWIIIYRKRSRTPDTEQQQDGQKAEPPHAAHAYDYHAAARGPSPWTHLHPGAQTAHRDPQEHAGTEEEEEEGLCSCCTMREHRVPLPATELGGTVLVTTKTV